MRLENDLLIEFINDLRNAYEQSKSEYGRFAKYTRKYKIVENAINKPAKSFYVSYDEAARVLHHIMKYGYSGKKGLNAKKFDDIYKAYIRIMQDDPDIYINQAIRIACESPAPRFYMCVESAIKLLNRHITL